MSRSGYKPAAASLLVMINNALREGDLEHRGSFSHRNRYAAPEAEITVREDAPEPVRSAIIALAFLVGLSPDVLRAAVCGVLLQTPDRNNWSADPVRREIEGLVADAPWYRVYDLSEKIYSDLRNRDWEASDLFASRLNEVFREHGVGYEMQEGQIVGRGSLAFREASEEAIALMTAASKPTAASEMRHALSDIARRPPDITGAVQHGMAALECMARDVAGEPKKSLGQLLPTLALPKPLDGAVEKLWGYASQHGRHLSEGRNPKFEEAELVVTVASAVVVYLLRSQAPR